MQHPKLDGGAGRPAPHDRIKLHGGRNRWLLGLVMVVAATTPVTLAMVLVGPLPASVVYGLLAAGTAMMIEGSS